MATTALLWAVHLEFLRYMQRIEDGQVSVRDGAERLPDGRFRFPVDADGGTQPGTALRFRGSVSCTGHHGLLAVTIAAPELIARENESPALSIDDPFAPGQRMPLAHLRPSPQDAHLFTAHLSDEGADLFQGVYPPGMALAPVRLEQEPGADGARPTTRSSTIPSTEDLS